MNNFDCKETFRRLGDYLDRELDEQEMQLVREHLHACDECCAGQEFEESLMDCLREKLSNVALPDKLKQRVFDRLNVYKRKTG